MALLQVQLVHTTGKPQTPRLFQVFKIGGHSYVNCLHEIFRWRYQRHVQRVSVSFAVDCHWLNGHLTSSSQNSAGNFTAIGNQNLVDVTARHRTNSCHTTFTLQQQQFLTENKAANQHTITTSNNIITTLNKTGQCTNLKTVFQTWWNTHCRI